MTPSDVLIVGGGVWGLSIAWHLALAHGLSVRVLERRDAPGAETSGRAAGQIGQVRETEIARTAALYALEFAASLARRRDPASFVRSGSVTVAATVEAARALRHRFTTACANGVSVDELPASEVATLVPGLTGHVASGYYVPSDGYVEPAAFTRALGADASGGGVEIISDVAVMGIDVEAGAACAVRTSRGRLSAGHVVVAAGPWTASLLRPLALPVWPIVLRQARTAAARVAREHPVLRFPELGAYVRPEDGGYLFGAFLDVPEMAPAASLPPSARTEDLKDAPIPIEVLKERLAGWLPRLASLPLAQYRHGWTSFAPDGLPVVGRHPAAGNLWFATGCGAMGFVWAPIIGRWLAQSINEQAPIPALVTLSPDRFGALAHDVDRVRDACRLRHINYYGLVNEAPARLPGAPSAEHYTWK